MDEHAWLGQLISEDRWRMGVLRLVCDLDLPESFVTGDFVRNMVWDHLHDRPMTPLKAVEVVYWAPDRTAPTIDENIRQELSFRSPKKAWSVVNAARGPDAPSDLPTFIGRGPETATAVAVSVDHRDRLTVIAPYGLEDLFDGIVRPVRPEVAPVVNQRAEAQRWLKLYPKLRMAP